MIKALVPCGDRVARRSRAACRTDQTTSSPELGARRRGRRAPDQRDRGQQRERRPAAADGDPRRGADSGVLVAGADWVRNDALLAILYRSGVRISEALALELRDIDPQAAMLNARHGTGGSPADRGDGR